MRNEMKPTTVVYALPNSSRFAEEDWIVTPDGREGKAQLGNFIKMMILYDSELDDEILEYFGTNFSLLYRMLKDIDWNTCFVQAIGQKKILLCKKLKIDKGAFEHHIRHYMRLNLILRVSKGEYMVNPMKIYAGDSADQKRRMMEYESYRQIQKEENDKKEKGGSDEI